MRDSGRMSVGKIISFAIMFVIVGTGLCVFGYAQGGNFDKDITFAGLNVDVGRGGIRIGRGGGNSLTLIGSSGDNNSAFEGEDVETDFYEEYKELEKLDINVGVCDIKIIDGDEISLEGSNIKNNEFTINYNSGKLTIKQKSNINVISFGINASPKLTLTIPSSITLEDVSIENGVGTLSVYDLNTETIEINVGVGAVKIDGLTSGKTDIKGGVGSVTAKNLSVEKLSIEGGVGKTEIEDCLAAGNITINGGVGNTSLKLLNDADEFSFDVNSGLGSVTLNGKSLSKDYKSSSSTNEYKLRASSGVGSISITTND